MAYRATHGAEVVIRRATARDAKKLTALVRSSRAYEGPYASMVAGYRVGPDYIDAHQVFAAVEAVEGLVEATGSVGSAGTTAGAVGTAETTAGVVGAAAETVEAEGAGEVSDAHEGAGTTEGAGAEAAAARGDASRGGPARAGRPGPGRGTILGFYALLLTPPEPELDLLFVADAAQGRGIGRLLMDHMKATARAAGEDHVRVVSHPPAEGFYTSVGALRTGVIRAYPPAVPWDRPELSIPTTP